MATSTSPQPPPPIQTTAAAAAAATTVSPTSVSDGSQGSSTITPGPVSTTPSAKPNATTPFTPFPPTPDYDDVESPSLTSGNAFARFEFERLDRNDSRDVGTKVLMVEWEEDSSTAPISGEWTIGWEGKSVAAIVPTEAQTQHSDKQGQLHRLYFLLPQWARVPGTVVLTLTGTRRDDAENASRFEKITWRTHPLPAIYPAALGNSARASGKRGVLHTVWAKKRLQSLASEIETEVLQNPESISLDLAVQERDWIEKNFGVKTKPKAIDLSAVHNIAQNPLAAGGALGSPTSPKSPGRGPLLEKLKGLKLATGEQDLKVKQESDGTGPNAQKQEHNPLSPETSDVAVSWSSFAELHGMDMSQTRDSLAAKPPQHPQPLQVSAPPSQPAMHTIAPPQSILEQQRQVADVGMSSLNAFTSPAASSSEVQFRNPASTDLFQSMVQDKPTADAGAVRAVEAQVNDEDDLFALPISPRSPERGPGGKKFTFGEEDTGRYTSGQ